MNESKHKIIIVGHIDHGKTAAVAAALAMYAKIPLHDAQEIVDYHVENPKAYEDLKPHNAFEQPFKIELLNDYSDKIEPVMLVEKDEYQTHNIQGLQHHHGRNKKYIAPKQKFNLRKHQTR